MSHEQPFKHSVLRKRAVATISNETSFARFLETSDSETEELTLKTQELVRKDEDVQIHKPQPDNLLSLNHFKQEHQERAGYDDSERYSESIPEEIEVEDDMEDEIEVAAAAPKKLTEVEDPFEFIDVEVDYALAAYREEREAAERARIDMDVQIKLAIYREQRINEERDRMEREFSSWVAAERSQNAAEHVRNIAALQAEHETRLHNLRREAKEWFELQRDSIMKLHAQFPQRDVEILRRELEQDKEKGVAELQRLTACQAALSKELEVERSRRQVAEKRLRQQEEQMPEVDGLSTSSSPQVSSILFFDVCAEEDAASVYEIGAEQDAGSCVLEHEDNNFNEGSEDNEDNWLLCDGPKDIAWEPANLQDEETSSAAAETRTTECGEALKTGPQNEASGHSSTDASTKLAENNAASSTLWAWGRRLFQWRT